MAAVIAHPGLDCGAQTALGHYTHEKSPVGCAAALATLDVIETEDLVHRARALGAIGFEQLTHLRARHPHVSDVRHQGCFFGVELGGSAPEAAADRVMYASLARGLSFKIGGGNVITLCPPLTIDDDDFEDGLDILDGALTEARA